VKIYHFYHVYADGKWKDPVTEHIDALTKYGLYDSLDKMFIGFVGHYDNISEVKQYLKSKIDYEIIEEQTTGWEQVTLEHLKNYSEKNLNDCIIYAHTKSSSDPSSINISWRKSMTYYNIVKWKECLNNLNNVDTVGCHWVSNMGINGIWGGNYWWATCRYVSKLPLLEYNNRHDAEEWIGSIKEKSIHDMNPGFPSMKLFKINW
jgi:hypothetical protein